MGLGPAEYPNIATLPGFLDRILCFATKLILKSSYRPIIGIQLGICLLVLLIEVPWDDPSFTSPFAVPHLDFGNSGALCLCVVS